MIGVGPIGKSSSRSSRQRKPRIEIPRRSAARARQRLTSSGEGIEEKREGATPSRFLNRYYARTAAASSTGFSTLDRGGVWLSWPCLALDGGLSWRSGADLLKMLQNRGDAVD